MVYFHPDEKQHGSSETRTPIYQATWRHIPQHGKLNLQRHEELNSYFPVYTITPQQA